MTSMTHIRANRAHRQVQESLFGGLAGLARRLCERTGHLDDLRLDLQGYCWLIYVPLFKPEPLVTVPGKTLAENRSETSQIKHLCFSFLI